MAARGGGGRGRGSFRGGFGRGRGTDAPMGDVSWGELTSLTQASSELYPVMRDRYGQALALDKLIEPSEKEKRDAQYQLDYLRKQRFSPYWPSMESTAVNPSASLASSLGIDGHTKAAVTSLKDVKLQKEVFPQEVWREFMEGETKRVARDERRKRSQRAKGDIANILDEIEKGTKDRFADAPEGDGADGLSEGEEQGDYEDEMDDDYNQNYFDPGEDDRDDLGDEGGGDDGAVYD